MSSAKLRKDLSHLGSYGTRGVGYDVRFLAYQISRELGPDPAVGRRHRRCRATSATPSSPTAASPRGVSPSSGLLDSHPDVVGQRLGITGAQTVVRPMTELESVVSEGGAQIGVIATPAEAAQDVCDRLVAAGVRSILNFAPVVLSVPEDVEVRKVDLAVELQILAFHEQRRSDESHDPKDPSFDSESLGEAINA